MDRVDDSFTRTVLALRQCPLTVGLDKARAPMRRNSITVWPWFGVRLSWTLMSVATLMAAQEPVTAQSEVVEDSTTMAPYGTIPPVGKLCPATYGFAEGLILGRDNWSDDRDLVLDLNTGEVLLTTDDLDFDWTGGLRVGYGERRDCSCWGWEVAYLGVFDQAASAGVELEDSLMLPGDLGLVGEQFLWGRRSRCRVLVGSAQH